jgi:hypothetical protein
MKIGQFRLYITVALPLSIVACQAPSSTSNAAQGASSSQEFMAPAGLSEEEQAAIMQNVLGQLARKQKVDSMRGSVLRCTQVFTLGEPQIVDTSLSGDSGKVRIRVPVTATNPVDNGPLFDPRYRYYYPSEYCYGMPASGWTVGMTSNAVYVVKIERWQSGWRLAADQRLVLD